MLSLQRENGIGLRLRAKVVSPDGLGIKDAIRKATLTVGAKFYYYY